MLMLSIKLSIKIDIFKKRNQLFYRLSLSVGLSDVSLSLDSEYALKARKPHSEIVFSSVCCVRRHMDLSAPDCW